LHRKCHLKHVTEGKIKEWIAVTGRKGKRCNHVLDDLETRGYWKLKEKTLDHTLWRTCLGRGYGPVTRQTAE
jgi:hypothetical protein